MPPPQTFLDIFFILNGMKNCSYSSSQLAGASTEYSNSLAGTVDVLPCISGNYPEFTINLLLCELQHCSAMEICTCLESARLELHILIIDLLEIVWKYLMCSVRFNCCQSSRLPHLVWSHVWTDQRKRERSSITTARYPPAHQRHLSHSDRARIQGWAGGGEY